MRYEKEKKHKKIRVMTEGVRCSMLSHVLSELEQDKISSLSEQRFNTLLPIVSNIVPSSCPAVEFASRHYRVITSAIVTHKRNAIFIATVIKDIIIFLLECSSVCYAQK